MKTLPIQFTKQGFEHEQVRREGNLAIYRRCRTGSARYHFEVARVGSHNGYIVAGKAIPPAETYPSAEQWGTRGWTLPDIESAEAKFAELRPESA